MPCANEKSLGPLGVPTDEDIDRQACDAAKADDSTTASTFASTSADSAPLISDAREEKEIEDVECKKLKPAEEQNRQSLKGLLTAPTDISSAVSQRPVQPKIVFPRTSFSAQHRSFNSSWYKHDFVEYSLERDAIFCFGCRMFPQASSEATFTHEGFNKWKDIGDALSKHARSTAHFTSMTQWKAWKQGSVNSVISQLSSKHREEISQNRKAVSTIAVVVVTCARQDIALRGHDEFKDNIISNKGNFIEILNLVKMKSPQVKKNLDALPRNATYCSKVSQNELLNATADVVSKQIVDEVAKAEMLTVIADELRDANKVEQMSICLRYVTAYEVQKRFLTFVPLNSDLTAPTLACAIADTLSSKEINIRQCVAQCYDGVSVMSGHLNGVQELFREKSGTP